MQFYKMTQLIKNGIATSLKSFTTAKHHLNKILILNMVFFKEFFVENIKIS